MKASTRFDPCVGGCFSLGFKLEFQILAALGELTNEEELIRPIGMSSPVN